MAQSPWHPRITPFFVYIVLLAIIGFIPDHLPWLYPVLYTIQCSLVVALLWRYRRLTPELTLRFHWLVIPTGLGLLVAWVLLGYGYNLMTVGQARPPIEPHRFEKMAEYSPALMWLSMILRLLGMSLVVPPFEELFTRSAMLRGLSSARKTGTGLLQLAGDAPIIGDWFGETRLLRNAAAKAPMFTEQLQTTPVGKLTLFGVSASTVIFMLNHAPRDYLGCIACGLVWCALLWYTNRRLGGQTTEQSNSAHPGKPANLGLGPIIWSHALTNAALWAYTLISNDWRFL